MIKSQIMDFVQSKGTATRREILEFLFQMKGKTFDPIKNRGYYSCAFNITGDPNHTGYLRRASKGEPRYLIKIKNGVYTVKNTSEPPLVEKFSHYEIKGVVKILCWGGSTGIIPMNSVRTNEDLTDHKNVIPLINDGGFGCERILAAVIDVWKVYDHGGKVYWYGESLNLLEPDKPISSKDLNSLNEYIFNS